MTVVVPASAARIRLANCRLAAVALRCCSLLTCYLSDARLSVQERVSCWRRATPMARLLRGPRASCALMNLSRLEARAPEDYDAPSEWRPPPPAFLECLTSAC